MTIYSKFLGIILDVSGDYFELTPFDKPGVIIKVNVPRIRNSILKTLFPGDIVITSGICAGAFDTRLVITETSTRRMPADKIKGEKSAHVSVYAKVSEFVKLRGSDTTCCLAKPDTANVIPVKITPGSTIATSGYDQTAPEDIYEALSLYENRSFYLSCDVCRHNHKIALEVKGIYDYDQDEAKASEDLIMGEVRDYTRAQVEIYDHVLNAWFHDASPDFEHSAAILEKIKSLAASSELKNVPSDVSKITSTRLDADWSLGTGRVNNIAVLDRDAMLELKPLMDSDSRFSTFWALMKPDMYANMRMIVWTTRARAGELPENLVPKF